MFAKVGDTREGRLVFRTQVVVGRREHEGQTNFTQRANRLGTEDADPSCPEQSRGRRMQMDEQ